MKIVNFATTTIHSIDLSSLKPAAIYYYQVISRDLAGNSATSSERTFTTPALPISPSPTLLPSLTILGFDAPVSANAGQSINLGVQVRNNGKAPAPASILRVTFIDNQAMLSVPPLNVESTAWVYWTATIPQNASGKYIFSAYCDPDNQILELSENDNGGGTEINVMPLTSILSPSPSPSPTSAPVTYKFNIGDRVQTTDRLNVRIGPSLTDTILGTQSLGSLGTVVNGPVSADGYIWWQVNYDTGADGWSVEDYLQKITTTAIPLPSPSSSIGNTFSLDLENSSGEKQYLSITDNIQNGLDITDEVTIEAWAKLESIIGTEGISIVAKNGADLTSQSQDGYQLYWNDELRFYYTGSGPGGYYRIQSNAAYPFNVNQWVHIAATFGPQTSSGGGYDGHYAVFYINGVKQPRVPPLISTGCCSGNNNNADLNIGSDRFGTINFLDGKVDEVRVWNKQRTASEIAENYSKELTGHEPNLVGYWKFNNELMDGKVRDYSSYGNHLTSNGIITFSSDTPF